MDTWRAFNFQVISSTHTSVASEQISISFFLEGTTQKNGSIGYKCAWYIESGPRCREPKELEEDQQVLPLVVSPNILIGP